MNKYVVTRPVYDGNHIVIHKGTVVNGRYGEVHFHGRRFKVMDGQVRRYKIGGKQ